MCSKCFSLASTHALRRTRHLSIAWSMMLSWMSDQASFRRSHAKNSQSRAQFCKVTVKKECSLSWSQRTSYRCHCSFNWRKSTYVVQACSVVTVTYSIFMHTYTHYRSVFQVIYQNQRINLTCYMPSCPVHLSIQWLYYMQTLLYFEQNKWKWRWSDEIPHIA